MHSPPSILHCTIHTNEKDNLTVHSNGRNFLDISKGLDVIRYWLNITCSWRILIKL